MLIDSSSTRRGSAGAITMEASDNSVEDILAILSRTFDMDYQSSIDLDKRLHGRYVGPLARVVTRILEGYNFVLKSDNGSISVTVVGVPNVLAASPAAPISPPSGDAPPAPQPGQSRVPAPIPRPSGSTATPAPQPGLSASMSAPGVGPKL